MGMILLDEGGGKGGGGYGIRQNGAPVSLLSVAFFGFMGKCFFLSFCRSQKIQKMGL